MFRRSTKQSGDNEERRDTLSELLTSEDVMVARLAEAREDAAHVLADAEEYARNVARTCDATIADRITSIQTQTERELEREFAQIRADAAREISLLENLDDRSVEELAALVIARLVAGDGSSSEDRAT